MIFRLDKQRHVVVLECIEDKRLLDLVGPYGADGKELPGEGILFVLQNISADLHCEVGAVSDLHVPRDAERPESLQMSDVNFVNRESLEKGSVINSFPIKILFDSLFTEVLSL